MDTVNRQGHSSNRNRFCRRGSRRWPPAAGRVWTSPWRTSHHPTSDPPPNPSERLAWSTDCSTWSTMGLGRGCWRRCSRRAGGFSSSRWRRRWRCGGTATTWGSLRSTPISSTPRPNPKETSMKISASGLFETKDPRMMLTNGLLFPCWKETIKLYHATALATGKRILSLIALSLNLGAEFFDCPVAFLRLLHYPGEVNEADDGNCGASAHSDYGILTLLATDGTPGLQICREKDSRPQLWEDVRHIEGALIVNIGDLLERWTNCVFRSALHRVVAVGKERYSVAFFLDPDPDLVVECLESCCSEACPPRFPPIKCGDYLEERLRATYK